MTSFEMGVKSDAVEWQTPQKPDLTVRLEFSYSGDILEQRVADFVAELEAVLKRPDGRYGVHGNHSVDDGYFSAVEYIKEKLEDLLAADKG